MEKFKKWFDPLVSASFVVLSVVFVFVLIRDGLFKSHGLESNRVPDISPGQGAPKHQEISYSTADKTMILFLSTSCRFCTESLPAYGRFAKAIREAGVPVQTVAVFPEDANSGAQYLNQESNLIGLPFFRVLGRVNLATMGVRATPTIALVGRDNTVLRVWRGKLSESEERELLEMLVPTVQ